MSAIAALKAARAAGLQLTVEGSDLVLEASAPPPSASCARLQSRQLLAHAGNARPDQGLVADEPEGEADQDRREGRQPRPLRRIPDGRGRHSKADVPGDSAADRGTAAAAAPRASMRRPCSCVHHQTTGGVGPNARENDQISPSIAVRTARGEGRRPRHPPVLPERQKSAKIHAGSGFIWRISV